jgi:tetratricopeptide (TPR) repeat protein
MRGIALVTFALSEFQSYDDNVFEFLIRLGGKMSKEKAYGPFLMLAFTCALVTFMPQPTFAQISRGIELYNSGEYRAAESIFQESLKTNPADYRANYYFGLSALAQEKYGDAEEAFLKVKPGDDNGSTLGSLPSEYELQIALARARLGLKAYEDAWSTLEFAKVLNASSSDVYVYRGLFYLEQEKNKEALEELEKAISLDPQNPYAFYYEGLVYLQSAQLEPAVNALETFLNLAPFAPEAAKAKLIIAKLC